MRQEINPGKTGTNRAAHKGTQTDTLTKGKGKTGLLLELTGNKKWENRDTGEMR